MSEIHVTGYVSAVWYVCILSVTNRSKVVGGELGDGYHGWFARAIPYVSPGDFSADGKVTFREVRLLWKGGLHNGSVWSVGLHAPTELFRFGLDQIVVVMNRNRWLGLCKLPWIVNMLELVDKRLSRIRDSLWREHSHAIGSETFCSAVQGQAKHSWKSHRESCEKMFEDAHPCDAVLLANQWLRALTGKSRDVFPDPEFLVNRQTGLPENAVMRTESLRLLQFWAIKGLMKEFNTKARPEEMLSLLNRSSAAQIAPNESEEQTQTASNEDSEMSVETVATLAGTFSLSGLTFQITEFPCVIGSNPEECSLVIPHHLLRNPQGLLPIHCVVDKTDTGYTIECFGNVNVDGVDIKTVTLFSLSPASTITIAGAQISFFPSE